MTTLKLTAIGNSLGVILPKEILALLNVDKGDALYITRTPGGVELRAFDPEFSKDMEIAERIMREDRDVLKKLLNNLMIEPNWVGEDRVIAVHRHQIAEHGGGDGVRDTGLLQSALARPQNAFHYNKVILLTRLAAAYAYGIAKNHPFIDGNKRTAYVTARLFLIKNEYDIDATREEKYLTFISLADGTLTEEELAGWFESKAVKLP